MTERVRARVFGEVADAYDDVRAGYPAGLAEVVLAYLGRSPARAVEVGAGTGKATAAFAGRGLAVTCLEPDPAMAAVLARRFAGDPAVTVRVLRFEDWTAPDGGVDLLYSGQAWHWVDPRTRWRRAYDALAPGGVAAIFGHRYHFADQAMADAVHGEAYAVHAPELMDEEPAHPVHDEGGFAAEMRAGRFGDVRRCEFDRVVRYPTGRYLALLSTFSNHRMLAEDRRAALHAAVAGVVDARGGIVEVQLATELVVGRRG